jgi:branched-chain amino acid transport system substrate-binding protein
MAKKPDAVFSSIWGPFFVTLTKQAKPLGYFDAIKYNFIGAGEIASPETTKAMGAEYPVGVWGNSYDAFYWQDAPPAHRDYTARLSKFLKDDAPSSWSIQTYIAMQFLAEAIKKAGSTDSDKVARALLGLSVDTPHGKMTIREKDHQVNRGQLYGQTAKDPKYPFPIMKPMTYVDPTKLMD